MIVMYASLYTIFFPTTALLLLFIVRTCNSESIKGGERQAGEGLIPDIRIDLHLKRVE